jgi:hypothetical protein
MISRQRLYMIISIFFMILALTVYVFNSVIIPGRIDKHSRMIEAQLLEIRYSGFYVDTDDLEKGTFINEENYDRFLSKTDVYSEKKTALLSYDDIKEGFYLKSDVPVDTILNLSDIARSITNDNSRIYEIKVSNSFCGELRAGETVDLIYLVEGKIHTIAAKRQIKGVYGYSQNRYVEASKILTDSEAIIFMELSAEEFEKYLSSQDVQVRKLR